MKASTGDWIVVESGPLGGHRRHGLIVGLRHADGQPPYLVRWIDDDHETLFFPGPEAHVEHHMPEMTASEGGRS